MSKKTSGFVAVGRMGANMARHLNDPNCKEDALYGVNRHAAESLADDMSDRDHECCCSVSQAAMDSGIAAKMAGGVKLKLPINVTAQSHYDLMTTEGLSELDKSGIAGMAFPGRHAHPKQKRTTKRKTEAKKK